MFADTIRLVTPLYALILGGYFMTVVFSISEETLVRVVADFFMPFLIFHALYHSTVRIDEIALLAGAVIIVFVLLGIAALAYTRLSGFQPPGAFALPLLFMNSGFIGIPLMELWGGLPAMNLVIIYDQVSSVLLFTVVCASRALRRRIQLPAHSGNRFYGTRGGMGSHFILSGRTGVAGISPKRPGETDPAETIG